MDNYSMLHGFPTSTPGSWDPMKLSTLCPCGDDVKLLPGTTDIYYKQRWADLFLKGHSWFDIVRGKDALHLEQCKECE
eukprot:4514987-Karenia_brevis.AAC.1